MDTGSSQGRGLAPRLTAQLRISNACVVPGLPLQTEAFVLLKRPPADSFQSFTLFSAEHGILLALQRVSKKPSAAATPLDLLDEVSLSLESRNQGQTWFVQEARLVTRQPDLGRSYETLRLASALASLVARNPVSEESRQDVAILLRQALAAFAAGHRADFVWFKSLYRFARDEGYPLKEQWFPTLPADDRAAVAGLLNRPLAEQAGSAETVARLTERLMNYLRGHTEIILD
jgi:hypothetical protein